MSKKLSKDEKKMTNLNNKFTDIQTMRERITGESDEIGMSLKKMLAQRKAISPENMTKNLKSISSFLDNFSRMITNLSSKVNSLGEQVKKSKVNSDKIITLVKSIK